MAGALTAITVGKTPQRIQTWLAPNESFLLVNNDITNQIFIGNDPGTQSIPVPPLGSISLGDAKKDIWVSTGGAAITVQALLFPSGTQWTPSPAQVAAQINALGLAKETTQQAGNTLIGNVNTTLGTPAQDGTVSGVNTTLVFGTNPQLNAMSGGSGRAIATDMLNANKGVTTEIAALVATGAAGGTPGGVPLLRNTKQLAAQGPSEVSILGGHVTTVVNSIATNQPSYEMAMTFRFPTNAGTIPFGEVLIEWFDAATGTAMDIATFVIAGGNNQQIFFNIYGPNRGDEIFVQITNLDPAQTLFATWVVNATSHVYERDRLIQPSYQSSAPNGFQNPAGDPTTGVIASANPTLGPNATTSRLIAAYNGIASLEIDDGGQANDVVISVEDPGTLYSTNANAPFFRNRIAAGQRAFQELALPHGNVSLVITNGAGTNTITPKVTIVRKDF